MLRFKILKKNYLLKAFEILFKTLINNKKYIINLKLI